MLNTKIITSHFRHLLMSVTLLWALVLNGQEVVAYAGSVPGTTQQTNSKFAVPSEDSKTVVKQKVSLEATTSFVALNLQQALEPVPFPVFASTAHDILPAHTSVPRGASFVQQLFPVTIQPNAP